MNNKYILLAANILFNHRLNKTGLKSLPKKCIPQDTNEAYEIQNELKILYELLKKGGVLIIGTPNISSIAAKIFKGNFRLFGPSHI